MRKVFVKQIDSTPEAPAELVSLSHGSALIGANKSCTLCGATPAVTEARYKNPLGNIDYTHIFCDNCADKYGVAQSGTVYKAEPMEQAFLLLKDIAREIAEYQEGMLHGTSPYHSLRLSPVRHEPPVKGRKLGTGENRSFLSGFNLGGRAGHGLPTNEIIERLYGGKGKVRNSPLPLLDPVTGQSLSGRFVFPAEALTFSPNLTQRGHIDNQGNIIDMNALTRANPDVPPWIHNDKLNLYGFEGIDPQRFGDNAQAEGIIYGDVDENKVHQLNDNPLSIKEISRASRLMSPLVNAKKEFDTFKEHDYNRIRRAAEVLMAAQIPPILFDSQGLDYQNIWSPDDPKLAEPTNATFLHDPFKQWDKGAGQNTEEMHQQVAQGVMSPKQLELLDHDLIFASEPMEIAMRLLKRQTNLGEHHQDFPSPYGPVVAYHGTTGDDARRIMGGGGLKTHSDNYRTMSTNPSEALSYAIDRSVGHHGGGTHSEPKLLAIRQAAFDQNHPNYIGPSHNFKTAQRQTVDFSDATHYGGNIPRQFLTNTPITNPVLENTAQARTNQQNDINTAMSRPALSTQGQIAQRKNTEIDTPNLQQTNQRGEVRPQEPTQNQLSRAKWSRSGQTAEQMMNDYNQQMTQYMQPNPVVQPTDPNQQQLPLQQPQVQQPQVQQPQMIQQGEPMDIAMRLLKMPQEAKDYATQIHEGQMYGEQPYMNHVEDVASGFDDPHLQRIAYLHDTIEDSETGIGEIHERFGEDVGHAVDALTRRQGEQYFDYINRVKEHPEATQVKLADLHSNLKNNPNESLAKRYQKAIGILTNKSEPMEIAMRLLKRQTTLSAFDERQIQENLKPQNSNIFIAAKPGNEETRPGELSQLSDNMLAELAALKEKHGEFGITSATGNAAWDLEPSFMLTNVPQSARGEINAIAEKYRQDSIAVSEKDETGAKFVTPQGQITDEYSNMEMDPNAEYSTDFPTGQRLTFKSEPMEIAMRLLKERVSPEAKRHKLEYDKKYESSPERVKYREELNRERRRRHIMGQGGPDMSHTSQHTIVPEDPHTNRARHFKDKGTLL